MANAAALIAGISFSNSMVGIVHGIGHALGAVCRIPHGTAMNILLPHCMMYNMDVCGERYADLLLYLAGRKSMPPHRKRTGGSLHPVYPQPFGGTSHTVRPASETLPGGSS